MAAPISSLSASPTMTSPTAGKPKDAADAAKQFEAMLIAQMLHSAREAAGDDALGGGDSAGSTMLDMADQQFSKLLADRGGLGLGSVIAKSLKAGPAVAPTSRFSNGLSLGPNRGAPERNPTI
jgi:Rod binding domain-containing protein